MNRKYIKQNKDMIIAFAEGKTIQERRKGTIEWRDTEDPRFDATWAEYRIKPEPNYRPFKTVEECWNEMLKHEPVAFLSKADEHDYFSICRVFEEEGKPKITFASNPYSDFYTTKVFNKFQFVDGTPFGIKEE